MVVCVLQRSVGRVEAAPVRGDSVASRLAFPSSYVISAAELWVTQYSGSKGPSWAPNPQNWDSGVQINQAPHYTKNDLGMDRFIKGSGLSGIELFEALLSLRTRDYVGREYGASLKRLQ